APPACRPPPVRPRPRPPPPRPTAAPGYSRAPRGRGGRRQRSLTAHAVDGERDVGQQRSIGPQHLHLVLPGADLMARPGPPATAGADRQVVARDLDVVAVPDVLDEAGIEAGHRGPRHHLVA